MAEEPSHQKTESKYAHKHCAKAEKLAILVICWIHLLSVNSIASPVAPVSQVQIAMVYTSEISDLSMPLWGGAAAITSSLQNTLPANEVKLHHFDLPCGTCHEAPTAGDSTFTDNNWAAKVDVNRSCTTFGCHEYDEKMNHPIDIPLPAGVRLPSGQSSTVTCLSCHQPELSGDSDSQTDRILQQPEQVGCDSCHSQLSGSVRQQSHWKFSRKAHLVTLVPGSENDKFSSDLNVSDIDTESSTCLSCHDEVSANVPAMNQAGHRGARGYSGMSDHPIGMNYQSVLVDNSMLYNSLKIGPNRIRMFDGKVGCGSCHSLYSQIPSLLAVGNDRSALCRECHNR